MPGGFIGQIVEAIMYGPEGTEAKSMSILGLDPSDPGGTKVLLPERAFQYWPESVQDGIEIGWQTKDIPGSSHALVQWGGNNGRTITFEVRLSRMMKPVEDRSPLEFILDPFKLTAPGNEYPMSARPFNVDIESEIRFLRAFCYPSYATLDGASVSYPPPIALLCLPGMGLNEDGSDVIAAVMTTCDVTYTLAFPNGKPRMASVSLAFRQVVQSKVDGVLWRGIGSERGGLNTYKFREPDTIGSYTPDATAAAADRGSNYPSPGAGRSTNSIDTEKSR